jgi:hypothetical protein
MTDSPADPGILRPWIICETGHRWNMAVCRFAPAMMPAPLVPSVFRAKPSNTAASILGDGPAVVLWEVRRESVVAACDHLFQTAIAAPDALQLVAGPELSDRERVVLSEFRCAAVIRHPEHLPRLAPMIRAYFASFV